MTRNNIIFRKITSTEPVVNYLTDVIAKRLSKNDRVLWLVPGGSAIKVAAEVSKQLPQDHSRNLTVSLTDERYGPVGHKDSNWPQLEAAGFKLAGATLRPVLSGLSLKKTADEYAKMIEGGLGKADFSVALAGMGSDGHIFGIKPHSPSVGSDKTVVGYEWDDFVRLTPTINFIKRLDEVVVYAVGEEKWLQLDNLNKTLAENDQPAQVLKKLRKVIIFNDHREGQIQ